MNTARIITRFLIFVLFLLPEHTQAFSGEKKISKIKGDYDVTYDVKKLLDSAKFHMSSSPLKAIDYSAKALELSLINHYKKGEGLSYKMLGAIHYGLAHYDIAIKNFEKAVEAFTTQPAKSKISSYEKRGNIKTNLPELFETYKYMALSYMELGSYSKANYYVEKCLSGDFSGISKENTLSAEKTKARILIKQNKFSEGILSYEAILDVAKKYGITSIECEVLIEIGKAYFEKDNLDKALTFFIQAKELAEMTKQDALGIKASDYIAQIYRQQKKLNEEVQLRLNTLNKNVYGNNAEAISKENYEIGNAYIYADQTDSGISYLNKGLIKQGYDQITLNGTALDLESVKSRELTDRVNAYKKLTEAYLSKGDIKKSNEMFGHYLVLQDSLEILRKEETKNALELSTTLGKKQQRVELLEKERELNEKEIQLLKQDQTLKDKQLTYRNLIIFSLIVVMLVMAGAGYFIVRSSRAKRRANQLLAMKSLRGQMNPHFIFNALNSVNHYISQNNERSANKYLSDFSRLMRLVMENSKHDFISLSEEVEILELYLQLEHARFKDKFDYRFYVDENIDVSGFELPPMVLQPYIENSIWHGLRYLDNKGFLTVTIIAVPGGLNVTIEDNGIGRKLSQEQKTVNQKKQHSLGMQNIENRIRIINEIFKTAVSVQIEDVRPGSRETGTRVNIIIPNNKIQH